MERLLQQGRDHYKQKDYAKALEYFNRAVGRGDPTPQLLDNLAATHARLSDLPSALKAAKKAIQAGRDDATGYLRAGLVLKQMNQPSVALEIYAHGLKRIKHVGQGYERLKKAHDESLEQLSPQNSLDPLTVLPRELGISVLEYLTFRQRTAIRRVSKGWAQFIKSEPKLWSHLDLTGARQKVRTVFISTVINTARNKLTAASLHRLYDFDKVLAALVHHCQLESLDLHETGLRGPEFARALQGARRLAELRMFPGTQLGHAALRDIFLKCHDRLRLLHCYEVKALDLHTPWLPHLPRLESLHIHAASMLSPDHFLRELTYKAPELRSLTLHDMESIFGSRQPMPSVDLRNCVKLQVVSLQLPLHESKQLKLPPSIQVLKLATTGYAIGASFFSEEDALSTANDGSSMKDLPNLEVLDLDMMFLSLAHVGLQFAVLESEDAEKPLSTLKSLSMVSPDITSGLSDLHLSRRLRGLQRLSLKSCIDLRDAHVDILLQRFEHLRFLDISGSAITGVSVKQIVKNSKITELVVNDCYSLGRDAVDWARQNGLKVELSMKASGGGERKVRY